jgi:hypothetical protein
MDASPLAADHLVVTFVRRRRRGQILVTAIALVALSALAVASLPPWTLSDSTDLARSGPAETLLAVSHPALSTFGPTPAWTQIPTHGTPGARYGAPMAYDARDGYTVLYGGSPQNLSGGELLDDTWTYLGGIWTHLWISGPGARMYESMAYDPADGYVVFFGGSGNCDLCDQTWIFAAGSWSELAIPGPPPRVGASLAWDPVLGELILASGASPFVVEYLTDTW